MHRTLLATAIALNILAPAARAGEFLPVAMDTYQAAATAGRPIVFHIRAPWCPVSAAQDAVLTELMKRPEYKDYLVLNVDFDTNKQALSMLRVERQGTLIVNRGPVELGRVTGERDAAAITALVARAMVPVPAK